MRKITNYPEFFYYPDPYVAYYYAKDIIRCRWHDAEPYIMKYPRYAFLYAYGVIKERWQEAEPIIMKYPEYAYRYAYHMIKTRWPDAEPYIKGTSVQHLYEDFIRCKL